MLHELDHPAFVEVIEKAAYVCVQNVVHILRRERERQRIQRVMLAAPRAEAIREAKKILFIDLIKDGSHGVLDELIFQGRNSEWTLPSIFFLYVHSSRGQRSIRSAMNPAMKINQPIFQPGLILLPGDPVHSGSGFLL